MALPSSEADRILARYSGTHVPLFQELVARHPASAVAFTFVDGDLTARRATYGELCEDAERFSDGLRARGVGCGDAVAVLMDHGRDLVTVLVGIWHAGAVAVPLFTELGQEAIAERLRLSRARLVVASARQWAKAASVPGVDVVVAGARPAGCASLADLVAAGVPGRPPAAYAPDAPIGYLFTSGTTGRPKGVPLPARMMAVFRTNLAYCFDGRPDDLLWVLSPPAWGYFVFYGLLAALAAGVPSLALCVTVPSPALVRDVLHSLPVTNFASSPTLYRALRDEAPPDPDRLSLRRCLSSGEPLPQPVREWIEATLAPVADCLGQTETGGWFLGNVHSPALAAEGQRDWPRPRTSMAVLPGFDVRILAMGACEPAPVGVAGRIAIRVDHSPLMPFTHYLDDPEQTAARFPYGAGWYVTGDAGILRDDGLITYLAREDDLIVSRGFNLSPAELEAVLLRHPAVVEAAAVGVPDDRYGQAVVLHVVPASGLPADYELPGELRAHVAASYGDPVPIREIRLVRELPRTVTGKLQRKLLR